jgi:L-ribulose-5-phosphate 3-epimerase
MPGNLTWEEKLESAKQAGFDYVEISIDETQEKLARLDWTEKEFYELQKNIYKTGIPIDTMCLSGHRKYSLGSRNELIRDKSLEMMEKAINFAAKIGIRIIQLAGYDVYYEEGSDDTKLLFEQNLKQACELAAIKGIMLGFETMETPFMDTVEKAMHYVNKIGSPYLGVYPDIGNLANAGLKYEMNVNDDIITGKGHIVAAHLKETIQGSYREIPYGTGHTDYVNNLRQLKELGVRMFVGEFWYVGAADWEKDLFLASDFLRSKIEQVF